MDINYDYAADCYKITIDNDTCVAYLHKATYWSSIYGFTFNIDKLGFIHEDRKIYITNKID